GGRVWSGQGGWPGVNPGYWNYSRLVMYRYDSANPGTVAETRVYYMPGDDSQVLGLAYESNYDGLGHDRVWYSVHRRQNGFTVVVPSRLGWFDPEQAPWGDGSVPLPTPAACQHTCNDQNFTNVACTTDASCTPRCVAGQCLLGRPGSCTTDADCAAQCGFFTCLNGKSGGCF